LKRLIGFEIVETGYKIQIPLSIIKRDSAKLSNWGTEEERLKIGYRIISGMFDCNDKFEFTDEEIK
jgi:hypothetical protein